MRNPETWLEPALPLQPSRRSLKSAVWLGLLVIEGATALQNVSLWLRALLLPRRTLPGLTLMLPAALNMALDRLNLTLEYHNVP